MSENETGPADDSPAIPHSTALATDADQRDLYCLECGYNLRGLAGDVRRCPECNQTFAVADLRLAVRLPFRFRPPQLETLPTLALVCVLVILFMVGMDPVATRGKMLLLGLLLLVWIAIAYGFGRSCRFRDGWATTFGRLQLGGTLVFSSLFGVGIVFHWLGNWFGNWVAGATTPVLAIGMFGFGLWLYDDGRRRTIELRRAWALDIAKRERPVRQAKRARAHLRAMRKRALR